MSLLAVVSFDADAIRIVTAQQTRDSLIFKQALTLTDEELEGFLALDHSDTYLITVNPPDALYETIVIPPVEEKLTTRIVNAELKRLHPELSTFSIAFRIIGDSVQDGRTIRRVACCLIPEELLLAVLEPFIRYNKSIRMIASTPYCLAHLVAATPSDLPETLLCCYDEGKQKTLFVHEGSSVLFTRQVPSDGKDWNTSDRQNVIMTLDYCFQTLRIRPGGAIAINTEDPAPPFVPFQALIPAGYPPGVALNYPAQTALLLHPFSATEDLRPSAYRKAQKEKNLIRYTSIAFIIATVIIAVILTVQGVMISSMQVSLNKLRQSPALLHETLANYQKAVEKRATVEPLITTMNTLQGNPSVPALLTSVKLAPPVGVVIQSITAKQDKEGIRLSLKGTITGQSLADVQSRFEALCAHLATTKGLALGKHVLESATRNFTVEATFKP